MMTSGTNQIGLEKLIGILEDFAPTKNAEVLNFWLNFSFCRTSTN